MSRKSKIVISDMIEAEIQKAHAQELYNLRVSFGYSQDKFSELLGVSLRTYQRYETGKVDIPSSKFARAQLISVEAYWSFIPKGLRAYLSKGAK